MGSRAANQRVKRTRSSHRLGCLLEGRAAYAQRWKDSARVKAKSF